MTSEEATPAPPPADPEPLSPAPARAADSQDEEALMEANNPLADLKAVNLQN